MSGGTAAVAFWLRLRLAIELVCLTGLGIWLVAGAEFSVAAAIAIAAILFLALHSLPIVATFILASRHSIPLTPGQRAGTPPLLRRFLNEWLAYCALFILIQPFERWWMGEEAVGPSGRGPVLLIHGYLCNRGAWWWLRHRLVAAGYSVATVNLEPPFGRIDDFAAQVNSRVEALTREAQVDRVMLVGHSMGGLVGRAYVHRFGSRRVALLLTLGTPHQGVQVGRRALARNANDLQPESAWLRACVADPHVPTISAWSPVDNFILPQDRARLPGAREIILPPVTHLAMGFSSAIADLLVRELAAAGERNATSPAHGPADASRLP